MTSEVRTIAIEHISTSFDTFNCPKNIIKKDIKQEFLTGGVELLWGNCTVFPVPVQGILTGGT